MRRQPRFRPPLSAAILGALALAACTERLPYGGEFREAPPRPPGGRIVGGVQMTWPVRGTIVSPYRPWSRPTHQGVDLAAPPGTPVVSAAPGKVSFVGRIAGYGNVVAMEHEGQLTTVYSHLGEEVQAVEGVRLGAGEVIGRVASQGYLHFEIRLEKEAVDPAGYFVDTPRPIEGVPEVTAEVEEPE
ncbi:MAG: murein hydrolase activator EnvC family protein, partial [Candidatus Binatia bacterium]